MMTQVVHLWVQTCNVKQCLLLDAKLPIVGTGMEREIVNASVRYYCKAWWYC